MPKNLRNSDDWTPTKKKKVEVDNSEEILDAILKSLETFYDPKGKK